MTPAETSHVAPAPTARALLARLARLAPLPDGLGFEVCELCGAFVTGRESLVQHMARAHHLVLPAAVCLRADKPVVSCDRCTERFWTRRGLSVHLDRMHGERPDAASPATTVCPLCKRTRLTDVMEHLARQHRITLVDMFAQRYCSVCQLTLHAARPFEHHMLTRHADLFQDRASLYAAIVMVDRATRGRAGMVARGRQPAVLSGAAGRPASGLVRAATPCRVCGCEFADEERVAEHARRVHAFTCAHCGRTCTSAKFLARHVLMEHSDETVSCDVCGEEVDVPDMASHLASTHVRPCGVTLTRVHVAASLDLAEGLERKRRRGSESSDSPASSDDDSVVIIDETQPAAKKTKTECEFTDH